MLSSIREWTGIKTVGELFRLNIDKKGFIKVPTSSKVQSFKEEEDAYFP